MKAKLTISTTLVAAIFAALIFYYRSDVEALRSASSFHPLGKSHSRILGLKAPQLIGLNDVPQTFLLALIAAEDRDFFDHRGFDFGAMQEAVRSWWRGDERLRGASTMTQQLAKTLFLNSERTLGRKLQESIYAAKLEAAFSKEELLTLYINSVEWGDNIYGVGEAAKAYFGKQPQDLEGWEIAYLTAILPNPRLIPDLPFVQVAGLLEQRIRNVVVIRDCRAAQSDDVRTNFTAMLLCAKQHVPDAQFGDEVAKIKASLKIKFDTKKVSSSLPN